VRERGSKWEDWREESDSTCCSRGGGSGRGRSGGGGGSIDGAGLGGVGHDELEVEEGRVAGINLRGKNENKYRIT
jgi:hypothetical protein